MEFARFGRAEESRKYWHATADNASGYFGLAEQINRWAEPGGISYSKKPDTVTKRAERASNSAIGLSMSTKRIDNGLSMCTHMTPIMKMALTPILRCMGSLSRNID